MPESRALLVNAEGQLVEVPASTVDERLASGAYAQPTKELIADADARIAAQRQADAERDRLSSPGGVLNTALQSAAQTITAPIDYAAAKLGADRKVINIGQTDAEASGTNAEIEAMRRANPTAAFIGDTVGQLDLGLATGGAGGSALAAKAGLTGLGKLAAASAIEGGVLGSADAMRDTRADAEHILFAGGLGALLGGGLGAGGHALGQVFGKVADTLGQRALQSAESSVARDAALEGGARGAAKLDEQMARASGAPVDLVQEFGARNLAKREEAIQASQHFDEFVTKSAFEMRDASRKLTSAIDDVTEQVRSSGLKEAGLAKLFGEKNADDVVNRTAANVVTSTVDEARKVLDAFAPEYLPAGMRGQLASLDRQLMQSISLVSEAETASQRYMVANGLKQTLDKTTLRMRQAAAAGGNLNAFEQDAVKEVAQQINDVANRVRTSLENEQLWGPKVAKAQREVNAIWHEGAVDALNDFGHAFERDTGRVDFNSGRRVFDADATKFEQVLRTFGTTQGDVPAQALKSYLHHVGKLVDKVDSVYDLGPETKKAAAEARQLFDAMKAKYGEVEKTTRIVNRWRELATYDRSGSKTLLGAVAGSVPVVGPLLERPMQAVTNPTSNAATNALRVSPAVSAAYAKVSRATANVASWIRQGAESNIGRKTATSAAIVAWRGGSQKDDPKRTADRVRTVLNADAASIAQHAPDVDAATMMHLGTAAGNAIGYLQSKLPPYAQSPSLLRSGRAAVLSKPDEMGFARVWGTIADPNSALDDLRAGRLMPDQVDALKNVYPAVYASLKDAAIEALAEADNRGHAIPIQTRQQIATLLDLDGVADSALVGAHADRIGALVARASAQQQQTQQHAPSAGAEKRLIAAATSPFDEGQQHDRV